MDVRDELDKLRAQLALCERLVGRLLEDETRQAIEAYASELEVRVWLLLLGTTALPASPW